MLKIKLINRTSIILDAFLCISTYFYFKYDLSFLLPVTKTSNCKHKHSLFATVKTFVMQHGLEAD